jgi:hypothetical protein
MLSGQRLDLPDGSSPHRAVRLGRPFTQAHVEQGTCLEQRNQLAERSRTRVWRDVHPNRAEEYQVKRDAEAVNSIKVGQLVIDPADARFTVPVLPLKPHRGRRLDRHNVVAK